MEFLFGDLNTVHAVGISMISMALVAASFNSFCVFFGLRYDPRQESQRVAHSELA